jgi:ATP-dependent Clp protease ATP-binding subunit ClpA
MFNRFTKDARRVVKEAQEQARRRGDRSIEAEHLLLALDVPGLLRDEIAGALDAEEERALAAVGVSRHDFDLPAPAPNPRNLPFGTSAKAALERALRAAVERRDSRIEERHVLLGVLGATEGRVPRALRIAGAEPSELADIVGRPRSGPD